MLDIQLLRKDIDTVARRLKRAVLSWTFETFNALEAQRKAIQVKPRSCNRSAINCPKKSACASAKIDASDVMAQVARDWR